MSREITLQITITCDGCGTTYDDMESDGETDTRNYMDSVRETAVEVEGWECDLSDTFEGEDYCKECSATPVDCDCPHCDGKH